MTLSTRWAFNISKWEPSEKEFVLATSCLQLEEKNRIDKLVYKKDVKASLAGRLMIKKFICENTNLSYDSIKLSRDSDNKPILNTFNTGIPKVSFNVSHHGSFTVLAGEIGNKQIGVDTMKFEYKGGKSLQEFFRIMKRNFSFDEWAKIEGVSETSNNEKLINFCRIWALKESYVKALGKGLKIDLSKINFYINSNYQENQLVLDSCLYIDNRKQAWIFEESLLDPVHCVSVALESSSYNADLSCNDKKFKILTSSKILDNVIPILPPDINYYKRYFLKEYGI